MLDLERVAEGTHLLRVVDDGGRALREDLGGLTCARKVRAESAMLRGSFFDEDEGEDDSPMMGLIIGSMVVKTKALTLLVIFSVRALRPGIFSIVFSMPLTTCGRSVRTARVSSASPRELSVVEGDERGEEDARCRGT